MDGELIARVLQLMRLVDMRLEALGGSPSTTSEATTGQPAPKPDVASLLCALSTGAVRLEVAILAFLEHFRRMYLGENVNRVSKVSLVLTCLYWFI